MTNRSQLLLIHDGTNRTKSIVKSISRIREDVRILQEKITNNEKDTIEGLCIKMKIDLFISVQSAGKGKNLYFSIGRIWNKETSEYIRYKIENFESSEDLKKSPEIVSKYVLLTMGMSKRIRYLFIDLFNVATTSVCLESLKYFLVVKEDDNCVFIEYCEKNSELERVGPCIKMEKIDEYYGEEYEDVVGKGSNKFTADSGSVIGRVYVPKQDLKEVKLKHSKLFKK